MSDAPPKEQIHFPCRTCGGQLVFSPTETVLKCKYCGAEEAIPQSAEAVSEKDFEAYLQSGAQAEGSIDGLENEIRCQACGATILISSKTVADKCPYCNVPLQNEPQQAAAMIKPASLLPFGIDLRGAQAAFRAWIASLWFAPSDLVQMAARGELSGMYVPYWTYDSMTITHYSGMRGDNYWETETYTETDANGRTETKTRQVMKTMWTPAAGRVDHFFDDVLIVAAHTLPKKYVDALDPWDLDKLTPYSAAYLSGFTAERYQVDVKQGFDEARGVMDGRIRGLCCQDIGGDQQQLYTVNTQHLNVTFKHLLLPIWHSAYRYRDQLFHIVINARTAEVQGERPISWAKVFGLVVGIAAAVGAVWGLVQLLHR